MWLGLVVSGLVVLVFMFVGLCVGRLWFSMVGLCGLVNGQFGCLLFICLVGLVGCTLGCRRWVRVLFIVGLGVLLVGGVF